MTEVKYNLGDGEIIAEYDEYGIATITRECFEEYIKKQIPKKPKIVEADMGGMDMETGDEYTYKIDEAHCINCDSILGNEYIRYDEHYCNICGQRISWEEEE